MKKQLSKKQLKKKIILLSVYILVFLVLAYGMYVAWDKDIQAKKETTDFHTLEIEDLEQGKAVVGSFELAMGCYAERYETDDDGIRNSDDSLSLYYLVPIYDIRGGYYYIKYFMSLKVDDDSDFELIDSIIEITGTLNAGEKQYYIDNGFIYELKEDVQGYFYDFVYEEEFYDGGTFVDWCIEADIFGTDDREYIKSMMVPYVIDELDAEKSSPITTYFFLGVAFMFSISLANNVRKLLISVPIEDEQTYIVDPEDIEDYENPA